MDGLEREKVKRILKGEESGGVLFSANFLPSEVGRPMNSKSIKEQVDDTTLSL